MYTILKALSLPPLALLLLLFIGLHWCWRRDRCNLALGAAAGLWLFSTPLVAGLLMVGLERSPALSPTQTLPDELQAIVVLSAGKVNRAPEFGADPTPDCLSLQRLRYAAALQLRSGLPLFISGGSAKEDEPSLARMMGQVLEQEWLAPVTGLEEQSRNTWENAVMTGSLLIPSGITNIMLITHAWHMPRATLAFRHAGFDVVPAPTGFWGGETWALEWSSLLPNAKALLTSYYAMHEYLGLLWYGVRVHIAEAW